LPRFPISPPIILDKLCKLPSKKSSHDWTSSSTGKKDSADCGFCYKTLRICLTGILDWCIWTRTDFEAALRPSWFCDTLQTGCGSLLGNVGIRCPTASIAQHDARNPASGLRCGWISLPNSANRFAQRFAQQPLGKSRHSMDSPETRNPVVVWT
jgi:hypothetical protein